MVAIKDFEMPKGCAHCKMCIDHDCFTVDCIILNRAIDLQYDQLNKKRMSDCPIVEIKESEDGKID